MTDLLRDVKREVDGVGGGAQYLPMGDVDAVERRDDGLRPLDDLDETVVER